MELQNETKISNELIKAVGESMGINWKAAGKLIIQYGEGVNGALSDASHNGTCQAAEVDGYMVAIVSINPWARTETLAHELRHVYQAQVMGADILNAVYSLELESEGHEMNVLEIDARESAKAWRV